MAKRSELTEEQFECIRDILPGQAGDPGRTAQDNHRFLNGVMWVLRSGAHWHDLPERYGNWKSAHKRFSRWAKNGVWEAVFTRLLKDPKNDYVMIDSTLVKAHQQAATGKRGRRSRLWGDPVVD
jgi:transposase